MAKDYSEIRRQLIKYKNVQGLMRYINEDTLKGKHRELNGNKATGIDRITKQVYESNLNENIADLMKRMKKFSYKPKAVRRVYIPKANGGTRPLGIPSYEDKLVQGIMADILNEIYEPIFLDCSYGFRKNKDCHEAIKKLDETIMRKKTNYVVEADIKGFFNNVNHEWLIKFLGHTIKDKNFIRYIKRFLIAGVMEDGKYFESEQGTPQGGLISPILANVYLHYVLDLWFMHIKKNYKGEMYLVRYADDFVVLFQYEQEAQRFYKELVERLAKFGLEVATDKTRIIPFGRFKGGKDKFDFLGFEFHNDKTINGKYRTNIITSRKKLKVKRASAKVWIKEHMHDPLAKICKSLNRKLVGHYNYYGINGNFESLIKFYKYIRYTLYKWLNRRDQKGKMKYDHFLRVWEYYIEEPRVKVDIWHWQMT